MEELFPGHEDSSVVEGDSISKEGEDDGVGFFDVVPEVCEDVDLYVEFVFDAGHFSGVDSHADDDCSEFVF